MKLSRSDSLERYRKREYSFAHWHGHYLCCKHYSSLYLLTNTPKLRRQPTIKSWNSACEAVLSKGDLKIRIKSRFSKDIMSHLVWHLNLWEEIFRWVIDDMWNLWLDNLYCYDNFEKQYLKVNFRLQIL